MNYRYWSKDKKKGDKNQMDKKIVLSNGAIAYRAEYKDQVIEEYKGNPF